MFYGNLIIGITILLAVISWNLIFIVLSTKNQRIIALATTLIVAAFIPNYYHNSKFICGLISSLIFQQHANGEVQLKYSSLIIPPNAPKNYCNQFTDEVGNPITEITYQTDGKAYCGHFWGLENETVVLLPYKKLPNNKVEYWAAPDLKIIAPIMAKDKELLFMNVPNKK